MKDGKPVTWAFGLFILVVYIGGFLWNLQKENDRLYDIAVKQKETIEQQEADIRDLKELLNVMFEYMETQLYISPESDIDQSPIHKKPI